MTILLKLTNNSESFAQSSLHQKQEPYKCGVKTNAALTKNYSSFESIKKSSLTTSIPVKFHIVRHTNGTGGLTLSDVSGELVKLNSTFALGNITFFECEAPEFINSDTYNDLEAFGTEDIAMTQAHDLQNVVNVYFVENITISGTTSTLCGYAAVLPYDTGDYIMVANGCTSYGNLTTCHEMGHYFSLLHTQSYPGDPQELVNGSNCSTAGDYVCDTPAEPTFSNPLPPVDSVCNYTGTDLDPNNQSYTPLTNNIMSENTWGYCWTSFTAGQMTRVNNSIQNDRNYLYCSNTASVNQYNNSINTFNTIVNNQELIVTCKKEFSSIKLMDINGKSIKTVNTNNKNGATAESINIVELANGVYLIQLLFENEAFLSQKIVINR
jgi:hypothetical protein